MLEVVAVARMDLEWTVVGTGDFEGDVEGDGLSGVLWRNQSTGAVQIWGSNEDPAVISHFPLPAVPDLYWKVVGTGDFDGNGTADIPVASRDPWAQRAVADRLGAK